MNNTKTAELIIDEGFKTLIRPLYKQEYLQLEENILADGCREPISVWNGIIVDGHNRYDICKRHNIPFSTVEMHFDCREEAISWICANQLGRRNLTQETRKFLIGMQFENEKIASEKKNKYGKNQYTSEKVSPPYEVFDPNNTDTAPSRSKTASRIADENHISRATVEKYATYTKAIQKIGRKEPDLVPKILSGRYKISHENLIHLSEMPEKDIKIINRRLEHKGPEFLRYQTTRSEIQNSSPPPPKTVPKTKESSTVCPPSTPSIKDMPQYDPDSEIIGLTLTIPSWNSSIIRVKKNADFRTVSDDAKQKLEKELTDLQSTVVQTLFSIWECRTND